MNVLDRVRIERDEVKFPSKGTWPQYRGRIGTVVEINVDKDRPEYGVVFGAVVHNVKKGSYHGAGGATKTWFLARELTKVDA